MRTRNLAGLIAAILLGSACHRSPAPVAISSTPNNQFAILVQHSPKGWTAHCEAGCAWIDVTMDCVACEVQIDSRGIARAYPKPADPIGFAFVLSKTESGWNARAIQGTRWTDVTWDCSGDVCQGRLDEKGVGRG